MSVLEGYVQLDSRWVNFGGVEMPEYPSIICSHAYNFGNLFYDDISKFLDFRGTEIISYIQTYDKTFKARLLQTVENVVNTGVSETVTFTFYGYDTNAKIDFNFRIHNNHMIYLDIRIFDDNNTHLATSPLGIIYDDKTLTTKVVNDFLKHSEIYLCINPPYTREGFSLLGLLVKQSYSKVYYMFGTFDTHTSMSIRDIINTYFLNKPTEEKEDNPVGEQGLSGENKSDDITQPELPLVSILNGFHNMYQPDLQVIRKVNKGLWTTNFIDNIIKLYNNPIESIVSLSLSPIQPPISDNVMPIIVGNLPMTVTTEGETEPILSRFLTDQYGTYTFGSLPLYENYGSYLDYSSNVSIYLPYVGIQSLNINDVMSSVLTLRYNVDFFTGDFIATLQCTKTSGLNSVMYHWKGNLLSHIPLSSSNFATSYLNGLNTVLSVGTGNVGSLISNLGSFKPDVSRGGNTSANVGSLDNFEAYLIVTSPQQNKPANYNSLKGVRSNNKITLSQGLGFLQCEEIHVKNINATEEEKKELEQLFKDGVIL